MLESYSRRNGSLWGPRKVGVRSPCHFGMESSCFLKDPNFNIYHFS